MRYVNIKELDKKFEGKYLKKNCKFNFLCHKDLSCFNHCCRACRHPWNGQSYPDKEGQMPQHGPVRLGDRLCFKRRYTSKK